MATQEEKYYTATTSSKEATVSNVITHHFQGKLKDLFPDTPKYQMVEADQVSKQGFDLKFYTMQKGDNRADVMLLCKGDEVLTFRHKVNGIPSKVDKMEAYIPKIVDGLKAFEPQSLEDATNSQNGPWRM